jgi:outer membrane protein assembly factor BamB
LKRLLLFAAALVVAGTLLYQFFGLRVVMGGGGMPRLSFTQQADKAAEVIARHREAQRAQMPPTPAALAPAAQSPSPGADVGAIPAAAPAADRTAYWTDFRGPARDGRSSETPVRTTWPAAGLTPLWKEPVGGGYASIVVARGRAVTIAQRGREEVVAAYEAATGRERWTDRWRAEFRESMGGDGPRATPTWFDGRVYALGATGEFRCLDEASGRLLWRKNILDDNGAPNLTWGMAASPLIVDATVVVTPGGPDERSVVAYDRLTGARAWSAQSDRAAYASPMLVTLAGTRQLIVVAATRVMGLTPEKGALLWEVPWRTDYDINAAQPLVIGDNRIFISSGYGVGAAVYEIARDADRFTTKEIWRNTRMKNKFASSVLHDGFIYGLDEAILACVDAATGVLKWKGGRYGYGQVLLAGSQLIVLTEDGDIAIVRATPDGHEERTRFPAIAGKTWNHPAIAGGLLLVRNLAEMAAFDVRMK